MKLRSIFVKERLGIAGGELVRHNVFEISEKACFRLFRNDVGKIMDFFKTEQIANHEADIHEGKDELHMIGFDYTIKLINSYEKPNEYHTIEGNFRTHLDDNSRDTVYKVVLKGLNEIKKRLKKEIV